MNSNEVAVGALPYVLVLHAFCLVDPTLCAPASNPSQFVVTLQPYLKTQVKIYLKSYIGHFSTLILFKLVLYYILAMSCPCWLL